MAADIIWERKTYKVFSEWNNVHEHYGVL